MSHEAQLPTGREAGRAYRRVSHLTPAERRESIDGRGASRKLNRWGPFTNPTGGVFSLSVADTLARSPGVASRVSAAPPWQPLSELL